MGVYRTKYNHFIIKKMKYSEKKKYNINGPSYFLTISTTDFTDNLLRVKFCSKNVSNEDILGIKLRYRLCIYVNVFTVE